MNWLNVPHQSQREPSWCLPACVAIVSAYWGVPISQTDVAHWLGTSDIGTPSNRTQWLNSKNFTVIYSEGSVTTLIDWLGQGCPLILFLYTGDLPYWTIDTAHAVVLAGLDGESAILVDPAVDEIKCIVSIGDLLLAWSQFDYTFAVIQPQS